MLRQELSDTRATCNVDFCTLGMFIIDEIEFEAPKSPARGIIGGAGSYAVVGARMVAGHEFSQSIGWIVDTGADFPPEIRNIILSWDTHCEMRENKERLTTRAWNSYGPNEKRDFRYLTPKIRLDHLSLSHSLLFSKTFHLVCSPSRCIHIVKGILERRNELIQDKNTLAPMGSTRPTFIWEPVPDSCVPEELQNFNEAIRYVDVVSPNELELRNLLGHANSERSKGGDQALVDIIMESGIGPEGRGILVVRAGREGCYAYYQGQILALPAYLATVVDPTGAGNAFLGALAQALISAGRMPMTAIKSSLMKSDSWIDMSGAWAEHAEWAAALICAIVAASFVVEQAGVPQVSISKDGEELWNGMNYTERVQLYAKQLIEVLETLEKPHALRT